MVVHVCIRHPVLFSPIHVPLFFLFTLMHSYKTVNLVTKTLGWLKRMLSVNEKSHMIYYVLTLRIFGAPKKLCFWQNREEMFNRLNSARELSCTRATCRGHGLKLRASVIWRGHVQGVCKLPGVICIYKWVELYNADSSRFKHRSQLIVKLKANKCY